MMVFEAEAFAAKQMISEFGQVVTWKRFNSVTTVVDKPWDPISASFTDYSVKAVFLPENREGRESHLIDQELQQGYEQVYIATTDFVPSLHDVIIRDSQEYSVRYIDRINPNGEQLLFIVGVKR